MKKDLTYSQVGDGTRITNTSLEELQFQINYTNKFYLWESRKNYWNKFLQGAINARS